MVIYACRAREAKAAYDDLPKNLQTSFRKTWTQDKFYELDIEPQFCALYAFVKDPTWQFVDMFKTVRKSSTQTAEVKTESKTLQQLKAFKL